ncbi:PREDICTED: uncharacterized protein LOC109129950 [Camelina sativa]|uniref:Uncharacterized protein LOC109129950 n=1 Tax=Camelina sativa TaxID=90675 RepID=A0ABM1R6A8_CAMSA|nr:PREDICTED: uncharacterized protein LOC109129950 [Camelina sativa]
MFMYLVGSGFSQGEVKWLSNDELEWQLLLTTTQVPIVVTVTSSLCGEPCATMDSSLVDAVELYLFKSGKEINRLENDLSWGAIADMIDSSVFAMPPSDSAPAPSPIQ